MCAAAGKEVSEEEASRRREERLAAAQKRVKDEQTVSTHPYADGPQLLDYAFCRNFREFVL